MRGLVRERYEPIQIVGRGGQGEVVLALDHQHDRRVALKIRTATGDDRRRALLAEARILLRMTPHPNLPLVREDFFDGDRYVIVMDWIEGTTLQRLLAERGTPGLPPRDIFPWLADVSDALDHLHGHRPPIVHQDVKPANVIVTPGGRAVLVDLGLASETGGVAGRAGGTRFYRAPEQAASGEPRPAADVFAFASTAFALLAGTPPGEGGRRWRRLDPAVGRMIEQALRPALSIDPARRPASAGAVLNAMREAAEGTEAGDREPAPGVVPDAVAGTPARRSRATRRAAAATAGVALSTLAAAILLTSRPGAPTLRRGSLGPPRAASAAAAPTPASAPIVSPMNPPTPASPFGGSAPPTKAAAAPFPRPASGFYEYNVDSSEHWTGAPSPRRFDGPTSVEIQRVDDRAGSAVFLGLSYNHPSSPVTPHLETLRLLFARDGVRIAEDSLHVDACAGAVADPCPKTSATYVDPVTLIANPATPGATWSGTTTARRDGAVVRTETYRGSVLDDDAVVDVAGRRLRAIVVEWRTDFTAGTERWEGFRTRKIWFSLDRGLLLKWEDTMEWRFGDESTYTAEATWTLATLP